VRAGRNGPALLRDSEHPESQGRRLGSVVLTERLGTPRPSKIAATSQPNAGPPMLAVATHTPGVRGHVYLRSVPERLRLRAAAAVALVATPLLLAACGSTPGSDADKGPSGSATTSIVGGFCGGMVGESVSTLEKRLGPPTESGPSSRRPHFVGEDGHFIRLFPSGTSWLLWREKTGVIVAAIKTDTVASVEFDSSWSSRVGGLDCP
jgi:hypothetical protein